MKNLAKILVMALLVGLFGVVAVSSLLATPSVQTPLVATTSYNVATGIRWNEGFGVFEVFNANGISHIASNHYFDASGEKIDGSQSNVDASFVKADGAKTYNIMQDIAFDSADTQNLESAFLQNQRHSIGLGGAVNGRGFILKNFPISIAEGTALFKRNEGTIQNIILENPFYQNETQTPASIGILVYENKGTIDGCEVTGKINTTNVINIAAIAYTGNGTIRNSVNYLNITTNGQYAAGIIASANNSTIFACENYGAIRSNANDGFAGGIVAYASLGEVFNCLNNARIAANDAGGILGSCEFTTVKSNKNFGFIEGGYSACGIVGGDVAVIYEAGNSNFGGVSAANTAKIYLGEDEEAFDSSGIYYIPSTGAFFIDSMIGLSYIGSGKYFDTQGKLLENATEATATSDAANVENTNYVIIKNIDYSVVEGRDKPLIIGAGTTVDGQGYELGGFPVRLTNTANQYSALFESIASTATVKNVKLSIDGTLPSGIGTGTIGLFSYENNGTIEKSELDGDDLVVASRVGIGGFAYTNSGTPTTKFDNCINKVNVTGPLSNFGGIMAYSYLNDTTTFIDCINDGNVTSQGNTATYNIGGIGGNIASVNVTACVNNGDVITSVAANVVVSVGGIIGMTVNVWASACKNNSTVEAIATGTSSRSGVGGIIGGASGADTVAVVVDCVNEASGVVRFVGDGNVQGVGGVVGMDRSVTSDASIKVPVENLGIDYLTEDFNGSVYIRNINYGSVEGGGTTVYRTGIGGIVGIVYRDGSGTDTYARVIKLIENENRGELVAVGDVDGSVEGALYHIGGILGASLYHMSESLSHTVELFDNENYADISVSSKNTGCVGGIIGYAGGQNNNPIKTRLYASGNLNDGDIVAGSGYSGIFAGCVNVIESSGLSCYGAGTSNSLGYVGNFSGDTNLYPTPNPPPAPTFLS